MFYVEYNNVIRFVLAIEPCKTEEKYLIVCKSEYFNTQNFISK